MLTIQYRRSISVLLLLCMLLSVALIPGGMNLRVLAADEPSDEDTIIQDPDEPIDSIDPAEPVNDSVPSGAVALPAPGSLIKPDPDEKILFRAEMPSYYQDDYPNIRFGSGTVANNGCSMTALAMVASYMTGYEYTPDALADYFGGEAENNIARLEIGSRVLGLTFKKASNWHVVYDALQKGKVAIVLVSAPSNFTGSQHFIVLNGITTDGKVLVKDPNAQNYEKWELKYGFEYGFETYDIWSCWEGGWVYDRGAMPKNPSFYEEPRIDHSNPRYPDIEASLTPDEIDLIAKVVWAEARGESMKGQRAVAEVILNRLNSPNFPNNLHDVIYGEGQFRTAWLLDEATPYQTQYEAIEMAMYGPDYVLPETVVYFGWERVNNNTWGWIGNHVFCHEFGMEAEEEEPAVQEEVPEDLQEDPDYITEEPPSDIGQEDTEAPAVEETPEETADEIPEETVAETQPEEVTEPEETVSEETALEEPEVTAPEETPV